MTATDPAADVPRITTSPRQVTRFDITTEHSYHALRARFEAAVPPVDHQAIAELVERGAPWEDFLDLAARNAPHHFMTYFRWQAQPIFSLAGDSAECTEYLMGNHTIAQRMFHHHPGVMLHAPLRTVIYADANQRGVVAFDRPSDMFASLPHPGITRVARELDRLTGLLLSHLDVPVPDDLT
ncbi:hypothetical protein ACIQU6_04520 [Streptomyces sp. NPDC090442]|jgi:hypothetical protein|uniref:hypothetical protein n=1 Tax=Streptomyces sp. NPDC090442 TaxID=3365962 RepID=UPI0037FE3281